MLIQRPWNATHTSTRRNELLHMDFLFMGNSYGKCKYLRVLKDDLSHYCELVTCENANGLVAASAVLDWYKRFGLPSTWMSDNGSHFRNTLMTDLRDRLGTLHTFVPVYTPWLNGTVERVNRDVLQVVRALLLEFELDTRNWVHLVPVIQANINHAPARSLKWHTPVEVFTGLDRERILNVAVVPRRGLAPRVIQRSVDEYEDKIVALRESLMELHADVVDEKERRRLQQQAAKKGKACAFTVGDFVLWSRADPRQRGSSSWSRGSGRTRS